MRKVFIIGIGAGNPDYVTVQAINALNEVDVFFIPNKGTEKVALRNLRTEICERFIKKKSYRLVDVKPPKRTKDSSDYKSNVETWHREIEESYEGLLMEELADGQCGAFLHHVVDIVVPVLRRSAQREEAVARVNGAAVDAPA